SELSQQPVLEPGAPGQPAPVTQQPPAPSPQPAAPPKQTPPASKKDDDGMEFMTELPDIE
ncbi:MAG: hypothetical protein O2945_23155, partial [Planctomycetota bacterium]|nr:hypothetical protein [Planctomycetota bacterium]